jgi:hypothetical protein
LPAGLEEALLYSQRVIDTARRGTRILVVIGTKPSLMEGCVESSLEELAPICGSAKGLIEVGEWPE